MLARRLIRGFCAVLWSIPTLAQAQFDAARIKVLKALRATKINVVAIHNHMIRESPRYVFLHYWGVGAVQDLAGGLRVVLDIQNSH
jgi:uncharacterized protein DUF1259